MRSSSNPEARPLAFLLAIEIFQKESITVDYKTVELFFKMADVDLGQNGASDTVTEFASYEDYLDSQITPLDLYYLEVSNLRTLRYQKD